MQLTVYSRSSLLGLVMLAVSGSLANADESCRSVGSEWVWFSDHIAMSVDYYVSGPADRVFEVGTGMRINGSVWGAVEDGEGLLEVTAYGMGAIHVRRGDNGPDFQVCVGATKLKVISACGKIYFGLNDCPTF